MSRQLSYLNYYPLLGAWLLVVLAGILLRPLIPVDETRYVSVAWEMWANNNFLVPFKNGVPYSDKPPLYFWIIDLGWWLFGVNAWWPRLIAPLLALACIPLINQLAIRLRPENISIGRTANWLLLGSLFWAGFLTFVQFDLLLVFCTLLGMLGWLNMHEGQKFSYLLPLAIGLGLLAKGPAILVHILPVGLLAPFWSKHKTHWGRWHLHLILALLIGMIIVFAWAIPAAILGGEEYRQAIFWGQTAERVINSFAHKKAFWWYLAILPLLLFPWILWPKIWRTVLRYKITFWKDSGLKFLLCWIIPTLVIFSLISGKQIKYLLPVMPALMLLLAFILHDVKDQILKPWIAGLLLLGTGLLMVCAPFLVHSEAYWIEDLNPAWGDILIMLGFLILLLPRLTLVLNIQLTTLSVVIIIVFLDLSFNQAASEAYDLKAISQKASTLMQNGESVAYLGSYHSEFNFLGRLQNPIIEVSEKDAVQWAKTHPNAYVLLHRSNWPGLGAGAILEQPYRSKSVDLGLWKAQDWLAALSTRDENQSLINETALK